MSIAVVGLSHKTASVTVRERIAFGREALPRALEQMASMQGLAEVLILSTCNRVELFAQTDQEEEAVTAMKRFLHNYHALKPGELDPFLYQLTSVSAIRHTFRVACGLDSLVIGEPQILGQIKDAYNTAVQHGCLGGMLHQLILCTLRVAKKVRNKTGISLAGWSVSRAAVELARQIFGTFGQQTVLVIGAGKMSDLTTCHLRRLGALKILVANRTYERALRIASQYQGEAVAFEDLSQALVRADIVISSASSASEYILQRADVGRALQQRNGRPMLFIDIALPRNVDPSVAGLQNAFLCDLDGLKDILASHGREIADTVEAAEKLVESEVDGFCKRLEHREIGPIIAALKNSIESIGCVELERHIRKLAASTPEDRRRLEEMVRRIANKILHPLIVPLKRQGHSCSPTLDYVDGLTRAFLPIHTGMLDHTGDTPPPCLENGAQTFGTESSAR
jgi:glutamyl-tRNA reductase